MTDRPHVPPVAASRVPLPTDARGLPALPTAFRDVLDQALSGLDLELTPGMREAIDDHARLLLAWAPVVNLTAIRDPAGIALEHVVDSLAAVPPLLDRLASRRPPRRPVGLLDLGSGAGYPGLPVAVAIPVARVALVDSVARKAVFLEAAVASAARAIRAHGEEPVPGEVLSVRAEELGRTPGHRDHWEIVTARAVAAMPWLLELALPLVRPGGIFVAWKRDAGDGAFDAELASAMPVLEALGGDPNPTIESVNVDGLRDHRLVFVGKRRATPDRWPRRARGRHLLLP
jgi:16S rRNA (guanine527-N7)-methyltransferase